MKQKLIIYQGVTTLQIINHEEVSVCLLPTYYKLTTAHKFNICTYLYIHVLYTYVNRVLHNKTEFCYF